MQDLIKQEQFEIEVLDKLNTGRVLNDLIFCGGTMLRLCWGLDRYSVDLDFWVVKTLDYKILYNNLDNLLGTHYKITDSVYKLETILFKIKSPAFPRSLKIEVRKELKKVKNVPSIAYSKFSNIQVMLKTVSLEDMMSIKIQTFLDRKEIRDLFDIEFLLKSGIPIREEQDILLKLLKGIEKLTKNDYTVKLGSLLESNQRKYYSGNNFIILRRYLIGALNN